MKKYILSHRISDYFSPPWHSGELNKSVGAVTTLCSINTGLQPCSKHSHKEHATRKLKILFTNLPRLRKMYERLHPVVEEQQKSDCLTAWH